MRRFGSLIWRNQHKKGKWCRREFSTQKQSWKRNGFASQIACFAGGVASCYAFLEVRKENDEFDVGMMDVRKEDGARALTQEVGGFEKQACIEQRLLAEA